MTDVNTPFSARHLGRHQAVDNSFPDSARMALIHLLYDLEERGYVESWTVLARELQRISRQPPITYDPSSVPDINHAKADVEKVLESLEWEKVFDFCERLHSHLSQEVCRWMGFDEWKVTISKSAAQKYISEELERIFLKENLAFQFSDGIVRRRGRRHTADQTARAQVVLGDNRLAESRRHYIKALQFFRNPSNPDYENSVKEAVCAVEAAGKALFPSAKAATLGEFAKWLANTNDYETPKALVKTIEGIYAYRNGGNGIGHGGSQGGAATVEVAEYVLSVSASQIIYLVDIENTTDDIPF